MRVLVACEESQAVCIAFRERGHEAYSCDIQECSGGHPEWHIQGNVLPLIDGNCSFITMDGTNHEIKGEWDLLIAHPPCTDLAVSGARWFAEKRADGRQQRSIDFFMKFTKAKCNHVAIENPVCIQTQDGKMTFAATLNQERNNYDKTLPIYDDIKNTGRSDRSFRNPWLHCDGRHNMWRRILRTLE